MKLIIGIAHERDKRKLFDSLIDAGIKFTTLPSTGGFLRRGNITVLIGTEAEEVENIVKLFNESCRSQEEYVAVPTEYTGVAALAALHSQPVKVKAGGGLLMVIDVERFETF